MPLSVFMTHILFSYTGVLYKDECHIQPYIPIFLIVNGSFGIFMAICRLIQTVFKYCKRKEGKYEDESQSGRWYLVCLGLPQGLVGLFLLAWFITGTAIGFKTMLKLAPNRSLKQMLCCEEVEASPR